MLLGFTLEAPMDILEGLYHIVTMQDLLITDYVSIGGPGAALVNAGLVTMFSICLIKLSGDPFNGFTIVEMGLMAGFSLFGKNLINVWPIILGTWLYARYQKEPFSKHASVALLATSLAPLLYVSWQHSRQHFPGHCHRRCHRLSPALPVLLYLQNSKRHEPL